MDHTYILQAIDDLRTYVKNLGCTYEKSPVYIGSKNVRVSFVDVDSNLTTLISLLELEFPEFKVIRGFHDGTVIVYIKGPNNRSPYGR